MKQLQKLIIALFLSLVLCVPSVLAVFYYTWPMEDVSYDFSFFTEDGQDGMSEGAKDWTVYIQNGEDRKELTSDGIGGYTGLDYGGQTFYFSRELTEDLDSPTLQIGVVNRTISVFLDDTLVYTDCPELDNRIGCLKLPMLEYDRAEPVTVSLPLDYVGRTLTIAQSSSSLSEKQADSETVYPCDVTLYCGYSYESGLIASSAKTMIPAVLLFALELFLLAAFVWYASLGTFLPSLPVLTLTIFFLMCSVLIQADFVIQYLGEVPIDLSRLSFYLAIGALLAFLTFYAGRLRPLFVIITAFQWASAIFSAIVQTGRVLPYGDTYLFFVLFPQTSGLLAMTVLLICSFFLWHRGNTFFRRFSHAALAVISGYIVFILISIPVQPDYINKVLSRLAGDFSRLEPIFSLKLVWYLCLICSLFAMITEILEKETVRRSETAILSARNELALESYENLRRQSEEMMMLRHDMSRHYEMLRSMAKETPERINDYLDELVEQVQNVRPVVASGNPVLDIIINGKLSTAAGKDISVEIVRSDAPEKLPLTDTELCCLMMNILDNAISAASVPGITNPYIKLDFHRKDQHFVFSCENSLCAKTADYKKIPMHAHGYGLKIIQQIMERWGEMVSVEQDENHYKVSIVIPLA